MSSSSKLEIIAKISAGIEKSQIFAHNARKRARERLEFARWNAVMVNLGRAGQLRFFAALPSDVLVVAISTARVEPGRGTHAHTWGSDPSEKSDDGMSSVTGTAKKDRR